MAATYFKKKFVMRIQGEWKILESFIHFVSIKLFFFILVEVKKFAIKLEKKFATFKVNLYPPLR